MKKSIVIFFLFLRISASQQKKGTQSGDYSYIGEYCTPKKFAQLPCLRDFCAEIDHEMDVWAKKNGSFQLKMKELYDEFADDSAWIAAFISEFGWTFDEKVNNYTKYQQITPPFDPQSKAYHIFDGHVKWAASNLDSACDGESIAVATSQHFVPQLCIRRGNPFRMTAALYRFYAETYIGPSTFYPNDHFYKYFRVLGIMIAPYFLFVIPIAALNVVIVYRVARECPGVWYHMAQTIGDILELIFSMIDVSRGYLAFAPLFAWTNTCQDFADGLMLALENFSGFFAQFALMLLIYDRYISMCNPEKYDTYGAHAKTYLPIVAIVTVFGSVFVYWGWGFQNSNPALGSVFSILLSITNFFYLTICSFGTVYFTIRAIKAARKYKPPQGASNYAAKMDKMKRFYHLALRVVILNSLYIIFLFYSNVAFFILSFCIFGENVNLINHGGICDYILSKFLWAYDSLYWLPELVIFTSNGGLIFHCIFSRVYRNEVIKLFYQVFGWIRCKEATYVVPLQG